MDLSLLVALAAILFTIILGIIFFTKSKKDIVPEQPRPAGQRLREGIPRRVQHVRNRGGRLRINAPQQDDVDDDVEEPINVQLPDGKVGAKKKAKLEAKAEKKAQREADEINRVEKRRKEEEAEKERKKQQEKQLADEKRRDEEEKKAREEKERQEHEEYLKMKEAFFVEEEGCEEDDENTENLLQEFVQYIKKNKVVVIEDLACHFKLKTQATIERIKDLQNDNILTGVIDDRGKFIYVSQDEMDAVAKFIRQRGRVSINELAENSNKLINLTSAQISL